MILDFLQLHGRSTWNGPCQNCLLETTRQQHWKNFRIQQLGLKDFRKSDKCLFVLHGFSLHLLKQRINIIHFNFVRYSKQSTWALLTTGGILQLEWLGSSSGIESSFIPVCNFSSAFISIYHSLTCSHLHCSRPSAFHLFRKMFLSVWV